MATHDTDTHRDADITDTIACLRYYGALFFAFKVPDRDTYQTVAGFSDKVHGKASLDHRRLKSPAMSFRTDN